MKYLMWFCFYVFCFAAILNAENLTRMRRVDHTDPTRNVVTTNTITVWGDHGPMFRKDNTPIPISLDRVHLIAKSRGQTSAIVYFSEPQDTSWCRLFADDRSNVWYDCMALDNDYALTHAQQLVCKSIDDNATELIAACEGDVETVTNVGWHPNGGHVQYSVLALIQRTADHQIHILASKLLPPIAQDDRSIIAVKYDGTNAWAFFTHGDYKLTDYVFAPPVAPPAKGNEGILVFAAHRRICQGQHESARKFTFSDHAPLSR